MLSNPYDVIATIGGEETLAAITGFTSRHVLIWRNRNWFPAVTYRQIRANLLARGLDASPTLFGPPMTYLGTSKNLEKKLFSEPQTPQHMAF